MKQNGKRRDIPDLGMRDCSKRRRRGAAIGIALSVAKKSPYY